ncbi:MAG: YaiI/YqxD family protein [Clostridia bacterium]|nr:YaiI/YqxD family protein [Clostridia bacterium]
MTVIIDADACPVTSLAIQISKKRNMPVICICDTSHVITSDYAECIICDKGRDSADIVLVNRCKKGDIVITQDYGVASMALAKGSYCMNQNGLYYTKDNIDSLLAIRHMAFEERRKTSKHHLKGPKKRTREDDERFVRAFEKLLNIVLKEK